MAYNFYPQIYQQAPQMMAQPQMQMAQPQQPIAPPQIQNNGFLLVPNEETVMSYPVAAGNCVTFKIEGKPIVMEKSMGFSQLESPRIEKYRLVKEQPIQPTEPTPTVEPDKITVENIDARFKAVWDVIEEMRKEINKPVAGSKKKKEAVEDDTE